MLSRTLDAIRSCEVTAAADPGVDARLLDAVTRTRSTRPHAARAHGTARGGVNGLRSNRPLIGTLGTGGSGDCARAISRRVLLGPTPPRAYRSNSSERRTAPVNRPLPGRRPAARSRECSSPYSDRPGRLVVDVHFAHRIAGVAQFGHRRVHRAAGRPPGGLKIQQHRLTHARERYTRAATCIVTMDPSVENCSPLADRSLSAFVPSSARHADSSSRPIVGMKFRAGSEKD